jgi:hypothetical protein
MNLTPRPICYSLGLKFTQNLKKKTSEKFSTETELRKKWIPVDAALGQDPEHVGAAKSARPRRLLRRGRSGELGPAEESAIFALEVIVVLGPMLSIKKYIFRNKIGKKNWRF